jgi:hypothetical protein
MMDPSEDIARGAADPAAGRVLTVFTNTDEEFVAEHTFATFDLEEFRDWFNAEGDPLMYNCYVVLPKDVEFLSGRLGEPFEFDFDRYCYFVEANAVTEDRGRR